MSFEDDSALFEQLSKLLHAGSVDEAERRLLEMLQTDLDPRVRAAVHLQLGAIVEQREGSFIHGRPHWEAALKLVPRMELASLALFHALLQSGLVSEAVAEMLRLIELRPSTEYEEWLTGIDASAFSAHDREKLERAAAIILRRRRMN